MLVTVCSLGYGNHMELMNTQGKKKERKKKQAEGFYLH